jgi:molybdopterin molybdotransferase
MRAIRHEDGIEVFERQDSSLLSVLGRANALVVRPVRDAARKAGDEVEYLSI